MRRLWSRFLGQETAFQRFVIALAALLTALGTIAAATWAVAQWVGSDEGPSRGSPGGRVEQGSAEADALITSLLSHVGGRTDLDVIVAAPDGTPEGGTIYAFLPLFYNCRGQAVGSDNCNRVRLEFGDVDPPATVRPPGVHFKGTYAVSRSSGSVFGTDLDIRVRDIAK